MSPKVPLILVALLAVVLLANSSVFDSGDPSMGEVLNSAAGAPAGRHDSGRGNGNRAEPESAEPSTDREPPSDALSPTKALGQMIVARFTGAEPPSAFLGRIEDGEVGGVILFEENLTGGEVAIGNRVRELQDAARRGGNPPLLVMVDQEGGTVKRLPGPPSVAPGAVSNEDQAHEEGEATGYLLRRLGINVDLAPVADVRHPGSFIGSRSFAATPDAAADLACSFAEGLRDEGIAATLKHFPGLGLAGANTDFAAVTIEASIEEIRADYAPYESCADAPLTLVMVNSAVYPALTGSLPAVMAPQVYADELAATGSSAITISDDLQTPAIEAQTTPARRSINAGLDLVLYARTEPVSAEAYARLLEDLRSGELDSERVSEAAAAIVGLKEELAGGTG